MTAFNAVGMDAVSMGGSTVSSSLNCSIVAFSTVSATLTVNNQGIQFTSSLFATSTVSAALIIPIRLQASLQSISSASASSLTLTQSAPPFTPSAARTIYVQATAPVFTGSKWWNLTDTKKPRGLKDPDATIDITFDWSDWLNDIGYAAISDVTFTVIGANNVNVFNDSTTATIFISGGAIGVAATVACKIQTNTTPARTDERTVYIDIADE